MKKKNLIAVTDFCTHQNIEVAFISSLQRSGLIEITTVEQTGFLFAHQLPLIEKFIHLHYDLDINLEGIESIHGLLSRIETLQEQVRSLQNKLRAFEIYESLD